MATLYPVSVSAQFITPPPSTSNDLHNHNDSDSGSSSGVSVAGEMKSSDISDDGGSTSSQQTPPEYPSPPPPSNSPPESMESLQAESPIGDEDTLHDVGEFSPSSNEGTSSTASMSEEPVKPWVAGNGYNRIPNAGNVPPNSQGVFLHVMNGGKLDLNGPNGAVVGSIEGPGTVVLAADPSRLNGPLPIRVGPNQQCHQHLNEEVPNSAGENKSRNSMNGSRSSPPGPSRGGHHSNGSGRGNFRNYNGNGNQRNGNQRNGNHRNGNAQYGHGQYGYGQNGHEQNGHVQHGHVQNGHVQNGHVHNGNAQNGYGQDGRLESGHAQNGNAQYGHGQKGHVQNGHVNNEHGYRNKHHNGGGNQRGNRFNGRGRGEYQGRGRREHLYSNVNSLQEFPMLSANNNQVMQAMINPHLGGYMNSVVVNEMWQGGSAMPQTMPNSLLGEPCGLPVADMTMEGHVSTSSRYIPGPQSSNSTQQEMQTDMQTLDEVSMPDRPAPPTMSGPLIILPPPGSLDFPAAPMTLPPQSPREPAEMILVSYNDSVNNNNVLLTEKLEQENRELEMHLPPMARPTQVNALATEIEFSFLPMIFDECVITRFNLDLSNVFYKGTIVINQNGQQLYVCSFAMRVDRLMNDGKCLFRVNNFKPNTSYQMIVELFMPTRFFLAKASEYAFFRTAPGRPDPPTDVELTGRGLRYVSLRWKPSNNNGANINYYIVEIRRNGIENLERAMHTGQEEINITSLSPQTCYKILLFSNTAIGQSLDGTQFLVWTKTDQPPTSHQNVTVTTQSPRSILVNWDYTPNDIVTLQLYCCPTGESTLFNMSEAGGNLVIGELEPDTDYQLVMNAVNDYGNEQSKWFSVKTQRELISNTHNDERNQLANFVEAPSTPFFVRYVEDRPEMAWNGTLSQDYSFIVEGSTSGNADSFIQLHRGNVMSYIVQDNNINFLRVIKVNRREMRSVPSQTATITRNGIHRPERVQNVTVFSGRDRNVVVSWKKLDKERMNIPTSANVIYHVLRCDLEENPVVNVGEADSYTFDNIPGNTKIAIQVRASVSFGGNLTSGDWCSPVSFTTPRGLPPPVNNIKFDSRLSTLSWNCADRSQDLQFTATVVHLPSRRNILKVTTKAKNVVLDGVEPGEKYTVDIYSSTAVGTTQQSTSLEFVVPALKPSTPGNIVLTEIHTQGFKVSWKASDSNGAPIISYTVRVLLNGQFVVEDLITKSEADGTYKTEIKNLSVNTEYVATISAKNSVGISKKAEIIVRTHPNPPIVPEIFCDPEAFSLKFHWEKDDSNPNIQYLLVRQNHRGPQATVYRGDKALVRVKSLQENTKYFFRLQISDTKTGANTWSEIFSFSTISAPPPTIKQSVTTTPVAGKAYLYKIEWLDCLSEQKQQNHFYRLQIADATVKESKWETIYEGKNPSYELNTEKFPGAIHVRVMCARQESDKELKGSPSPVGYLANLPPDVDDDDEEEESAIPFYKKYLPKSLTAWFMYILIVITVLTISCTENVISRVLVGAITDPLGTKSGSPTSSEAQTTPPN